MNWSSAFKGVIAPLLIDNIDTDQIIPSREMKTISKKGLKKGLFANWQYVYAKRKKIGLNNDFILNKKEFSHSSILLSGKRFWYKSSNCRIIWAYFKNNCARNGLLTIELTRMQIEYINKLIKKSTNNNLIEIHLRRKIVITPDNKKFAFNIDPFVMGILLKGQDFIENTLLKERVIDSFLKKDKIKRSWAHL